MKSFENKSVDLILCDLPYGVTKNSWDSVIPFDKLWKQYKRLCKGAIILFGQGLFTADLMTSNREMWKYNLVWNKVLPSGFLNANKQPLRTHEDICVFYDNQPTYNPQFTEGQPLHSKGNQKEIRVNNNYGDFDITDDSRAGSTEKYPISIINISKPHPSISNHATEKPVDLLMYLIKTYSNKGDTVLDNCMGSGSTGVACKKLNRKFIGIELNKEYFEVAKKRIKETQKGLF